MVGGTWIGWVGMWFERRCWSRFFLGFWRLLFLRRCVCNTHCVGQLGTLSVIDVDFGTDNQAIAFFKIWSHVQVGLNSLQLFKSGQWWRSPKMTFPVRCSLFTGRHCPCHLSWTQRSAHDLEGVCWLTQYIFDVSSAHHPSSTSAERIRVTSVVNVKQPAVAHGSSASNSGTHRIWLAWGRAFCNVAASVFLCS